MEVVVLFEISLTPERCWKKSGHILNLINQIEQSFLHNVRSGLYGQKLSHRPHKIKPANSQFPLSSMAVCGLTQLEDEEMANFGIAAALKVSFSDKLYCGIL